LVGHWAIASLIGMFYFSSNLIDAQSQRRIDAACV